MLLTLLGFNLNLPIRRAPLYVTTPIKPPPAAPDVYPNIAVNLQTQRPAGNYIDPIRYLPVPAAPDIYPNIAVGLQTAITWPFNEPVSWKARPTQPEIYPDLAAIQPLGMVIPAPIDPQTWRSPQVQPEIYPNVALNLQVVVPTVPVYTNISWRGWPAPDQGTNLAALAALVPYVPPSPIEPTFTLRNWSAPDILPNISLNLQVILPRVPVYVNVSWRGWAPPDQTSNTAAFSIPVAYIPPPLVEPTFTIKGWQTLDILPNVAATVPPPLGTISTFDELPRYKSVPLYEYPNLTVFFHEPVYNPPPYLETPPGWHYPVQVDVYPNIAIQFSTTVTVVPTVAVYTITWRSPQPQIDPSQNISALFPVVPPVSQPGHGGDDEDEIKRRKIREILHLKKLRAERAERVRLESELHQVEVEIVETRTERVEAEGKAEDLLQTIDALTFRIEHAKVSRKVEAERARLEGARQTLQASVRTSALRERTLEGERVKLKKRIHEQEEQEAMEAMFILMMMDEEGEA
jgi:hypothetical protein